MNDSAKASIRDADSVHGVNEIERKGRRHAIMTIATVVLGLHAGRTAFAKGKQRVGVLIWVSPSAAPAARLRKDLARSMDDLGFVDGKNISYEWRFAERDFSRLPTLAAELVRLQPDVILARLDFTTRALAQLTTTIPIVGLIEDPVRYGYSRDGVLPSRNVTGAAPQAFERTAKVLETLKSIIPGLTRIAIVAAKAHPLILDAVARVEEDARRLGLEPYTTLVSNSTDIESTFASMRTNGIRAVTTLWASAYTDSLAELAIRHGVALIGTPEAGGLLSLSAEFENVAAGTYNTDRPAAQLAKILRGIPISQIPLEFPRKYVLSINLKTAAALGLRIPQEVLLRADRIIE